jgi:hypothetical protein
MFVLLHINYPPFLSDFNETRIFSTDFGEIHKYQILVGAVLFHADRRTDGRTDVTKTRFSQFCEKRLHADLLLRLLTWRCKKYAQSIVTETQPVCDATRCLHCGQAQKHVLEIRDTTLLALNKDKNPRVGDKCGLV